MTTPSSPIAWFETSKEHLHRAKNNFESGDYFSAHYWAAFCGETALKAVLVKCGIDRVNYTHDQFELLDKIRSKNCLPPEVFSQVAHLIKDLGHVDLTSPSEDNVSYTDTYTPSVTRYPRGEFTPSEMVSKEEASEKIQLAEQLVRILEPIIYSH